MAQHTISTEDAKRLSGMLNDYERTPPNSLAPGKREYRPSSTSTSSGGGGEFCDCSGAIPGGTIEKDGKLYAQIYAYSSPSSDIVSGTVTYDEDDEDWPGDSITVECETPP